MSHTKTPKADINTAELKRRGYCVTSRRHRIATRIDRPDWKKELHNKYPDLANISEGGQEDYYRRMLSKDNVCVPSDLVISRVLYNSIDAVTGYVEF